MKYIALLCGTMLLFVLTTTTVFAQKYPTAIGVRLGFGDAGLTIQQPISEHSVLEGLATANKKDLRLTGLYEYHKPTKFKRIKAYFGGGAHVGRLHARTITDIIAGALNDGEPITKAKKTFVGLDGIAGLQWNMRLLPFNVSVDVKPSLNLGDHPQPFQFNAAVSIRFLLGAGGGGSNGRGSSRGKDQGGGYSGGSSKQGSGTGSGSGSAKKQGTVKGNGTGSGSGSAKRQGTVKGNGTGSGSTSNKSGGSGKSSTEKSGSVKSNPSSPSSSTKPTTRKGKVGGGSSSKDSTTTTNRSKGKVGTGSNSGDRTTTNGKVKGGKGTGSTNTNKPKIKPRNKPNDPNSGNEDSKDKDTNSKESWDD